LETEAAVAETEVSAGDVRKDPGYPDFKQYEN
jgi:hypothetical protein